MRVTNGAGGVTGGTNPFSTVNASVSGTSGGHGLSAIEIPLLAAQLGGNSGLSVSSSSGWSTVLTPNTSPYTVPYSSAGYQSLGVGSILTTNTSSSSVGNLHTHPFSFALQIQYCDMIIATKN